MKNIIRNCLILSFPLTLLGQSNSNVSAMLINTDQIENNSTAQRTVRTPGLALVQAGDENLTQSNLLSNGTLSSTVINQIGDGNLLNIKGVSTESNIGILQQGNLNNLTISLGNDYNSTLNYFQIGDGHLLNSDLKSTIEADMTIIQDGSSHVLDIQTDRMELTGMKITQTGNAAKLIIRE